MQSGTYYFMDVALGKTENFEMIKTADFYKKGRFFGPPLAYNSGDGHVDRDGVGINRKIKLKDDVVDPAFSVYAPPYYYGKSTARLHFLPGETKKFTLSEILSGLNRFPQVTTIKR